ncbi:CubicO group peptidase (beta-lactamase class C family) [Catalinimonas alkaloidigena]|uniref:serine hydrolase domain-containing protein n=1 Tax=Catalinimonas alkaloidigena TaxID=1075417 RepID=UPI002404E43E|nr:serine hydrolase domain-containing protein [Catalinimonas alkaloidigena]MDF9801134.1 CubicO group peptidase (beta-lactamase class C family) [Catalinimonas alkaloidigena]
MLGTVKIPLQNFPLLRMSNLVAGLIFTLLILGIPFTIADGDHEAFGSSGMEVVKSVTNLSNENSNLKALSHVDSAMHRFIKRQGIIGASVGIVKDGQLIYTKGFGHTDIDAQQTTQPYHLFRIGSISKLITAVAVMKLYEDGKLQLEDKVFGKEGILQGGVYDKIKDRKIYNIEVRHLLNHTSGWSKRTYGDPMFIPHKIAEDMGETSSPDLDTIIEFILSKHMPYRPGAYYDYSNFGYALLGKVIEAVSGEGYEDYVKKEILYPLGIRDMRLAKNFEEDRFENEVAYYDFTYNNMRPSLNSPEELVSTTYSFNIEALAAAGGWLATSTDLLKFLVAVDGFKNTPDILSNESLLTMVKPGHGGNRPYGWRGITPDGTWWRTGTLAGTSAIMKRLDNGISWVVLANTTSRRSRYFNGKVNYIMHNSFEKMQEWPSQDLFALSYY